MVKFPKSAGSDGWLTVDGGQDHSDTPFTCGIRLDGTLWCWGNNDYGQLGNGNTTAQNYPVPVSGGYTWTHISAGMEHACGVRTDGVAMCWGGGGIGELGNGTNTGTQSTPVVVSGGHTWRMVPVGVSGVFFFRMVEAGR